VDEEYDEYEDFGDRPPAPTVEAAPATVAVPVDTLADAPKKSKSKSKPKTDSGKHWKHHGPVGPAAEGENAESSGPPKYLKPVRFGGRLAYNNSYISALNVVVDELEMASGDVTGTRYDSEPSLGCSGFEAGAAVDMRLVGPLSFYTGVNFALRNPVAIKGALAISEMAVNVPVLFRVMVARPVFLDIGGQLDIPFGTKVKRGWGEAANSESRQKIDAGAVLGIGVYIIEYLSVDAKGVVGLMKFDDEHDKPVYQASVGVSYMY
jgi:hypothetical protein